MLTIQTTDEYQDQRSSCSPAIEPRSTLRQARALTTLYLSRRRVLPNLMQDSVHVQAERLDKASPCPCCRRFEQGQVKGVRSTRRAPCKMSGLLAPGPPRKAHRRQAHSGIRDKRDDQSCANLPDCRLLGDESLTQKLDRARAIRDITVPIENLEDHGNLSVLHLFNVT